MTSPNAAKGKRFEKAVLDFLARRHGRDARRPHQEGFKDVGDIHLEPFALQAKDEARHDFSGYVRDAQLQAGHAGLPWGAAVVKRRRAGIGDAYVVMTLETFSAAVDRLLAAEDELRMLSGSHYAQHIAAHTPQPEHKE